MPLRISFRQIPLILISLFAFFHPWAAQAQEQGYCGDGVLDAATEQCDDKNFLNRDGCSSYCKLEDLTPPTVSSTSVPYGATGVPTTTTQLTVVFSEPIDPKSVTPTSVRLEHLAKPMELTLTLEADQKTLTIRSKEDLFPESKHSLRIQNIKDVPGNFMVAESITVFETGTLIDHTPPTVVVNPPAGTYPFAQNVTLTPYIDSYTGSDEFIDSTAKIRYTVDGSEPTDQSPLYKTSISIQKETALKFFAVDAVGNKTPTQVVAYHFGCPEMDHTKRVARYPFCNILECEIGFVLRGSACVVSLEEADPDDYKTNAVTAPLFTSDTPVSVLSKPAIYVTPEHKGLLPRPILFRDSKRGTVVRFERNTKIMDDEGKAFSGYLLPPVNLYLKDFPINFGYSFRSIFEFKEGEGKTLLFDPPFHITIPYTDAFNPAEGVSLFTYNPKNEQYTAYDPKLYSFDLTKKEATFTSGKTGIFFVAQAGTNYNRALFNDIETHWAKNYIESLYRKGVVKGRDNGIFAPDEPVTRAEFIKIALKAAEVVVPNADDVPNAPFRDSPLDAWFTPYLSKAKELKLIAGYKDNTFKPNQKINRAEAVKILLSAFNFDLAPTKDEKPDTTAKAYPDLLTGQWYYESIDFALRHKMVDGPRNKKGNPFGNFGPEKPITRAEMSKLAFKAMEWKEELAKKAK